MADRSIILKRIHNTIEEKILFLLDLRRNWEVFFHEQSALYNSFSKKDMVLINLFFFLKYNYYFKFLACSLLPPHLIIPRPF